LFEQEYITTINGIKLNREYVMIEMERGVQLHRVVSNDEDQRSRMFPEEDKQTERLVSADLMDKFFIYSTDVSQKS
jgi:hypothetical protein